MSVSGFFAVVQVIVVLPVSWLVNTYKEPHGSHPAGPGMITPSRLNWEGSTVSADKSVFSWTLMQKPMFEPLLCIAVRVHIYAWKIRAVGVG